MKKIVVPVDFSEISGYGSDLAIKTATHLGAEVHFIHVITLPSHILLTKEGELFEDGDFDTSIPKKQKEEALVKIKEWAAKYYPSATTCVCFGQVNEQVMQYADKQQANLIVLGTHTSIGLGELINSTHGEYIAMHSSIPVMTLKCDRSDMEVKNIMIAGSFKKGDIPHCEMALAMQQAFNAKLYLVRINTPHDSIPEAEALEHMKAFADKHQLSNIELAVYNDQTVEEGIMHYTAKENIDIIAIGSWQRTGINKLIKGCVSADLLNHLYKPILTFKLKD